MTRWYSTKGAGSSVSIDDEPYTGFADDALLAIDPQAWDEMVRADTERVEQRHREQARILNRRKP